jgi:hypothetical protein
MTEPAPVIRVAPDWQPWPATAARSWPAPAYVEPTVKWRLEILVAEVVTLYSLVLGGAVGLLWPHVAPHVQLVKAINGSEAATKALLGDDMWLALLGIAAGVLSAALLALVGRNDGAGPGGAIGLAVGGVCGSLVAAHVGHLVQQPHLIASLQASFPGITHRSVSSLLGYFDFKLRTRAVLMAWPLAAVILHAGTSALRFHRAAARRARRAA